MTGRLWWVRAGTAVLGRPDLWRTALYEASVTVAPRWWASWPPMPRPPAAWMAFRMETAYGDPSARPDPDDVIAWLEWCKSPASGGRRSSPR